MIVQNPKFWYKNDSRSKNDIKEILLRSDNSDYGTFRKADRISLIAKNVLVLK